MPAIHYFPSGIPFDTVFNFTPLEVEILVNKERRQDLILWLQWHDRDGTYSDDAQLWEYNKVLTKDEILFLFHLHINEANS